MKKLIGFLCLIFSMVLLFSCEPSRDENGDLLFGVTPPDQTGTVTGRLLTKIINRSLNEQTGDWEKDSITFYYSEKKLVSIVDTSDEPLEIAYGPNNKISSITNSGQNAVFEYSDDFVSRITTDIVSGGKITATFTYSGNRVVESVSVQKFPNVPQRLYVQTIYEYQGENLIKATVKSGRISFTGDIELDPEAEQVLDFSYDNKKSPYRLLPKELVIWISGLGPQSASFLSANNVTKVTTVAGGETDTQTFTYTYDSQDYPVELKGEKEEFTNYEYEDL